MFTAAAHEFEFYHKKFTCAKDLGELRFCVDTFNYSRVHLCLINGRFKFKFILRTDGVIIAREKNVC
jgi:hypothetical protein